MSDSDEEPYSTIFASLKHPIRRRILRMLSKKPMSFTEMLEALKVSSPFLTYHLENLGELVFKTDDGKYRLSSFGEAAITTMTKVEDIPTTILQQSPETKPERVVGRSIAMALGIICILLIALIAYFTVTGISAQNSYNNLQNQNKQLQTWLDGNETLLGQTQANNTNLQNQIDSLNSSATNLQNQVNNFHIWNTGNSTVWANNENVHENSSNEINFFEIGNVPSAGYVSIRVSSNNNSTYVGLGTFYIPNSTNIINGTFNSNGTIIINLTNINSTNSNFFPTYYQFSVGYDGTVVFPVLPNSWIGIYVGISFGEATQTVTITYYY